MAKLKLFYLIMIAITLSGCEGGSGCSGSKPPTVDEYISFSADFEGNNTLIYDDNEYSSGCGAELIATRKTDSNYQPQMQLVTAEQHNGNQHSIKFDEFSRITFVESLRFIKFSSTHTFHFWIKPTTEASVTAAVGTIGANGISIADNEITIGWEIKSLSADITMNTWQHIAIVDDTQNIKLIVNGVATSTLKVASTHQNVMRIGSDNFRGNVDKINFTNEVLSEEDITNIYENTKTEYEILNDALGATNLMQQSQLVAQGRIESVDYVMQEDTPITVLTLEVANVYKGQLPAESQRSRQIKLAFTGGLDTTNGDIIKQGHCPDLFYEGQNYLFFIAENGESHCPFVKNNNGVYQIFNIDNQDYVFNLDGFPVTKFSESAITTGIQQNAKFLQNTEKNIEALKQDDKIYATILANNTDIQFCNCLTPFYDYQELAQEFLSQQRISSKNSLAKTVAQVMPSATIKGMTLASMQSALTRQVISKQSIQLTAVNYKATTTNNEFKNFNGLLNIQLNEPPQVVDKITK